MHVFTRTWLRYVRVYASTNLSAVVCNVHAPYSARWNFRQCFYAILYSSYPQTSTQNYTEINNRGTPPEGLNASGVAKYNDVGPVEDYIWETVQNMGSCIDD